MDAPPLDNSMTVATCPSITLSPAPYGDSLESASWAPLDGLLVQWRVYYDGYDPDLSKHLWSYEIKNDYSTAKAISWVIRDTRAAARPAEYESVVTIGPGETCRGSVTSLSSAVLYIKSEFHSVNSPSHPTSMAASSLADFVTHSPEVRQAPAPGA
jgi:hypothetical protein